LADGKTHDDCLQTHGDDLYKMFKNKDVDYESMSDGCADYLKTVVVENMKDIDTTHKKFRVRSKSGDHEVTTKVSVSDNKSKGSNDSKDLMNLDYK